MNLSVNGRVQELPRGAVLIELTTAVAPSPRGIAVAINGCVVPAAEWATTFLREGDEVEVVTAHQGG